MIPRFCILKDHNLNKAYKLLSSVTPIINFQQLKILLVSLLFFYCWVYIFETIGKIIDSKIHLLLLE